MSCVSNILKHTGINVEVACCICVQQTFAEIEFNWASFVLPILGFYVLWDLKWLQIIPSSSRPKLAFFIVGMEALIVSAVVFEVFEIGQRLTDVIHS